MRMGKKKQKSMSQDGPPFLILPLFSPKGPGPTASATLCRPCWARPKIPILGHMVTGLHWSAYTTFICIRRRCGSKQPTRGRLRGSVMDQSFAATASRVRPAEPRPPVRSLRLRLRLRHPERRAEAEPRLPVASARAALFCCRVACLIARTE